MKRNKNKIQLKIYPLLLALIFSIAPIWIEKEVKYDIISHLVIEGESLWIIASEHNKKGNDIRNYISDIANINELDEKIVYPGQIIKIPIFK